MPWEVGLIVDTQFSRQVARTNFRLSILHFQRRYSLSLFLSLYFILRLLFSQKGLSQVSDPHRLQQKLRRIDNNQVFGCQTRQNCIMLREATLHQGFSTLGYSFDILKSFNVFPLSFKLLDPHVLTKAFAWNHLVKIYPTAHLFEIILKYLTQIVFHYWPYNSLYIQR